MCLNGTDILGSYLYYESGGQLPSRSNSPNAGVNIGDELTMNTKLTMKRKLATVILISLFVVFGVETMAVASSNPFSDSASTYQNCPGDDDDQDDC